MDFRFKSKSFWLTLALPSSDVGTSDARRWHFRCQTLALPMPDVGTSVFMHRHFICWTHLESLPLSKRIYFDINCYSTKGRIKKWMRFVALATAIVGSLDISSIKKSSISIFKSHLIYFSSYQIIFCPSFCMAYLTEKSRFLWAKKSRSYEHMTKVRF